jgi:hypothetical protein
MTKVVTPSEGTITAGQIGKIQELLGAGLRKSGLLSEPIQNVIEQQGDSLVADLVAVVRRRVEGQLLLVPRARVSLVSGLHNPDVYYKTRSGLYVWDDFRNRIVAKATPVAADTKYSVAVSDLTKNATDEEIEDSLPTDHLFDESAVCAIVATMIEKQKNGEPGDLENTGYVNLFYTSSFVVYVRWHSVYREWYVGTWSRDDYGWNAGYRVLSPSN